MTTQTTTTIDPDDFEVEAYGQWFGVGSGNNGYYFSVVTDNGAHPNSPYFEDYYYEDGPFGTMADAVDEGARFIDSWDEDMRY